MENFEGQKNPVTAEKDKYGVESVHVIYECCGLKGFTQWLGEPSIHLKKFTEQVTAYG